ncbi:MAG: TldD/PmbA family protein [Planctomycetota bacterium]|jgi:predicted Zn-dependent protease
MQQAFYELIDGLTGRLEGEEVLLANVSGEDSDFVRFNQSRVRQAGHVRQSDLSLHLIDGQRHVSASCTLTGDADVDRGRATEMLLALRELVPCVPEDPYLLYATELNNTEQIGENALPDSGEMTDAILAAGEGLDLVGIQASGGVFRGFANSLGQRNWFTTHNFHFDWSFYHAADKAVKTSYAGFEWDAADFGRKVTEAREQLAVLDRPAKTIEPGKYRVYLPAAALAEVLMMLSMGYSLKAQRTKTTCLLKMLEAGQTFAPAVTMRENTAEGLAPNFVGSGFIKPDAVTLIEKGQLKDSLASPRTAKEYGVETTGSEHPTSLDMTGGDLPTDEVLSRLDTGIYVNRLWYLNYSDRPACRLTGMTRFATFWVEGGEIVAPLNVMRFDETAYRMLGENLLGLTSERDLLPSNATYRSRSTGSMRLPGALIDAMAFTL